MSLPVDIAIRATLVLLAALLATLALRRAAAATRHFIWTLAMACVLMMPMLKLALPEWPILPSGGAESGGQAVSVASQLAPTVAPLFESPSFTTARAADRPFAAPALALALWIAGTGVLVIRIGAGIQAVRRLARHARPAGARYRALLDAAQEASGVTRSIRLLVSRDIAMPMTWGGRRPLLLLPQHAVQWPEERIRMVLLHELAHVHRADWLTHVAARIVVACHWFNPLAWIALRAMTRERERACDDVAIARGAVAADYAQHLLEIARGDHSRHVWTIAPAMARGVELEGRLLSVLTPHRREPGPFAAPAVTLAGVALALGLASAAPAAAPRPARTAATQPAPESRHPSAPVSAVSTQQIASDEQGARRARTARDAIVAALDDPSDSVREKAVMALAFRGETDAVEPLLRALKDPSAQVREKAALGLAFRRRPDVADALLAAARDDDSQVREKAVFALSVSGDPRAIDALAAATQDADDQVREKAVQGLALASAFTRGRR